MKKIFSLFAAVLFAGSMMAESITITPSDFKSTYQTSATTFTKGETGFSYVGAMYNGKNSPTGFASKQLIQLRKSASGAGEIKNTTELNLKSIIVATQNDKAFTLSVGTAADALSAVDDPVKTSGKYACKDNNNGDKEIDVTIYTFDVAGKKYFDFLNGASAQYLAYITIELGSGEAPAVAKPVIAGETSFFDETEVSITCETEGAKTYYTIDGAEPSATSTEYTGAFKLNASATVKAIAIKGEDKSTVVEKEFVKAPSYNSIEDLVASSLASGKAMRVSFTSVEIDSVFTIKAGNRRGIYVHVLAGEKDVEIYYGKDDVPAEWKVGGTVSGTITGTWTLFNSNQWEIVPAGDSWKWTELTYKAPREVITSITFEGFDGFFKVGMTWNKATMKALYNQMVRTSPAIGEKGSLNWLDDNMQDLFKWDADQNKYVELEDNADVVLTAGKYYFEGQVRIGWADGELYRLASEEEGKTTIIVDGVEWVMPYQVWIGDGFSYAWVRSPEFTLVDDPTGVEDVMNGKVSTKVLRDGVLIIERDGVRYNVLGEIVR